MMRAIHFLVAGLLNLAHAAPSRLAERAVAGVEPPTSVAERAVPTATFSDKTIFSPPSDAGWTDPRVLYPRIIQLTSGALLATWENYSPEPPLVYYPVYRSVDGGLTWSEISRIEDTVNNWGLRYQPFLYQVPEQIGSFPAGTIVCAGNSIPTDLSESKIDIYVSQDEGVTWEFVSSVARGGEARPTNGLTPVWKPHLLAYKGTLICYYADQRDPKYGQKLSHQTTTDLRSWSDIVDDVHDNSNYEARPGMPVIALLPNGQYIFVFEVCGTDGCRVHYRLSEDPLNFIDAADHALVSDRGSRPVSSPYVVWTSAGGENGSIIVSSGTSDAIFVNKNLGAEDSWVEHNTPQPRAYSRALVVFKEDPNYLGIMGAGWLPPSSTNRVSVSVIDLQTLDA